MLYASPTLAENAGSALVGEYIEPIAAPAVIDKAPAATKSPAPSVRYLAPTPAVYVARATPMNTSSRSNCNSLHVSTCFILLNKKMFFYFSIFLTFFYFLYFYYFFYFCIYSLSFVMFFKKNQKQILLTCYFLLSIFRFCMFQAFYLIFFILFYFFRLFQFFFFFFFDFLFVFCIFQKILIFYF